MKRAFRFPALILGVVGAALPPPPIPVEPRSTFGSPGNVHRLVQAELDYLLAARRPITLEVDGAEPAAVLQQIRERSGIVIEVQGLLPNQPMLSASYRDTQAKVVLEWFAQELPISFRAEPPNTLRIFVNDFRKRVPTKEAG